MRLAAGQIVLVDWRDALPSEPNKQHPAPAELAKVRELVALAVGLG